MQQKGERLRCARRAALKEFSRCADQWQFAQLIGRSPAELIAELQTDGVTGEIALALFKALWIRIERDGWPCPPGKRQ